MKVLHEPSVSESLFRTVKDVLRGRRLSVAPKKRRNPNFPLNCFVRCDSCGVPITGGLVTGKNKSRKFGYYWCRKPGCRSVMARREDLEMAFVAHLQRLRPDQKTLEEFPKIAEQAWKRRQGDSEAAARQTRLRLDEQKSLKSELRKSKLRGEITQTDYAQANAEFDSEIAALEEQLRATTFGRVALKAFLGFANAMLIDLAAAWQRAQGEQRVRVQNLLFQNGLRFSQKSKKFEHLKPCLFSTMEEMTGED